MDQYIGQPCGGARRIVGAAKGFVHGSTAAKRARARRPFASTRNRDQEKPECDRRCAGHGFRQPCAARNGAVGNSADHRRVRVRPQACGGLDAYATACRRAQFQAGDQPGGIHAEGRGGRRRAMELSGLPHARTAGRHPCRGQSLHDQAKRTYPGNLGAPGQAARRHLSARASGCGAGRCHGRAGVLCATVRSPVVHRKHAGRARSDAGGGGKSGAGDARAGRQEPGDRGRGLRYRKWPATARNGSRAACWRPPRRCIQS
jgi:hypothetical protein